MGVERDMVRSVISRPLRARLDADGPQKVVIELNPRHADGLAGARARVAELLAEVAEAEGEIPPEVRPLGASSPYLAATLPPGAIAAFARRDREEAAGRADRQAVRRIWPDFPVRPLTDGSAATVKADAARASFGASGRDVVWAVLDSGIDGKHPHFRLHDNLRPPSGLAHVDFTAGGGGARQGPADRRVRPRHARGRHHRRRAALHPARADRRRSAASATSRATSTTGRRR